jgi:hypothetical protein
MMHRRIFPFAHTPMEYGNQQKKPAPLQEAGFFSSV